jgi:hypothetical protein
MAVLRPHLTDLVWKDLLRERAVNLYGAPFTGRMRLLEDLLKHPDAPSYKIILIDIKNCLPKDYQSFLDEITNLLEMAHIVTPHTFQNIVVHGLVQHTQIIFLWNHFDAIFDHDQHHFPMEFFNDLNSLKNYSNFYHCCVTEKPHDQSRFKAVDGKESKMSWLHLFPRDTADDKISLIETRTELKRLGYTKADKEKVAIYIQQDAAPMQLFMALQNKMHLKLPFAALITTMEQFRKTKYGRLKPSFFNRFVKWIHEWKK